jgi:hypothetical protein
MVAKVSAALAAVARGIARVRIGALDILTNPESGTQVVDVAGVQEVAA